MSYEPDQTGDPAMSVSPVVESGVPNPMPTPAETAGPVHEVIAAPAVSPPTGSPEHTSDRLAALIEAGLQVEIDRREQERLMRQGPLAGAD